MGRVIRNTEIHARRVRRAKLHKLKARYKATSSASEKEKILQKVGKISPWTTGDMFIAAVKGK